MSDHTTVVIWVIDIFLCSFSVCSCHLFLIYFASASSIAFLSFIVPIFAWNILLVSLIFLKRSLVLPVLLFSSISLHWSLRKAFLSLLSVLWKSAFRWVYLSLGIHVSFPLNLPTPSHPIPRLEAVTDYRFELLASYTKFPLAICFTHSNVCV